jgi:hypothetical protein
VLVPLGTSVIEPAIIAVASMAVRTCMSAILLLTVERRNPWLYSFSASTNFDPQAKNSAFHEPAAGGIDRGY